MQPISAAFATAIRGTYQIANSATVWGQTSGVYGQLLPGRQLKILSGSVTVDTTQAVRRSLTLTLADPQGWLAAQATPTGALSPFGNEIRVSAGVTYPGGATELVPLGVFAITSVSPTFGPSGAYTVAVQGSDRGFTVGLRLLRQPVSVSTGSTVASAIQALVGSRLPNGARLVMDRSASSVFMDATTFSMGDNPWQDAVGVAANAGFQLYLDVNGDCQLRPVPSPVGQSSVWGFTYGAGSMVASATRNLTQQGVANDFVMIYEGTGTSVSSNPPIQAEAMDLNPQSATYVYGPFGRVPQFVYTTVLQGQPAALAGAQQLLLQAQGSADGMSLTTAPVPMLDGYDVATVDFPRLNVNGNYVLQAITSPIGLGTASLTLRRVAPG